MTTLIVTMSSIYAYNKLRLLEVDNLNKPINEVASTRCIKNLAGKTTGLQVEIFVREMRSSSGEGKSAMRE